MKKHLIITILCVQTVMAAGQLTRRHNALRPGDQLVKQQIDYVEPGVSGKDKTWDLRHLELQGKEYLIEYSSPVLYNDSLYVMGLDTFPRKKGSLEELVIGREHHTFYYYLQTDSSLTLLGFSNPLNLTRYRGSSHQLYFPLDTLRREFRQYTSTNTYSGRKESFARISTTLSADCRGSLILPSGDTLGDVLGVRTVHTTLWSDQEHAALSPLEMESFRWYAQGYRYPILESITTRGSGPGSSISFSTSFYYPPHRHTYYDADNAPEKDQLSAQQQSDGAPLDGWPIWRYYPNPVKQRLTVEYQSVVGVRTQIRLYDPTGQVLRNLSAAGSHSGVYLEQIDLSVLPSGNYVLEFIRGDFRESKIVIKE